MTSLPVHTSKRLVLIVDDSAFARRKTRELLEKLNYAVVEASSGAEAVAACRKALPDAVVLDMVMTGMNGDEVIAHLHAVERSLPVIVSTADIQERTAETMRSRGAVAVLTKPLTLDRLAPALAQAFMARGGGSFTPAHREALAELINIGYGRAAAALSAMTGERIALEAPEVVICAVEEVQERLGPSFGAEVACVNQVFAGPIAGNAMLLMDCQAARDLSGLLENGAAPATFDARTRETITEVGNILLGACLGIFGNLLKVQVSFAVPRMHVDSASTILRSMSAGDEQLRHTVLVRTRFSLSGGNVTGFLAILLGVTSLDRLRIALDRL